MFSFLGPSDWLLVAGCFRCCFCSHHRCRRCWRRCCHRSRMPACCRCGPSLVFLSPFRRPQPHTSSQRQQQHQHLICSRQHQQLRQQLQQTGSNDCSGSRSAWEFVCSGLHRQPQQQQVSMQHKQGGQPHWQHTQMHAHRLQQARPHRQSQKHRHHPGAFGHRLKQHQHGTQISSGRCGQPTTAPNWRSGRQTSRWKTSKTKSIHSKISWTQHKTSSSSGQTHSNRFPDTRQVCETSQSSESSSGSGSSRSSSCCSSSHCYRHRKRSKRSKHQGTIRFSHPHSKHHRRRRRMWSAAAHVPRNLRRQSGPEGPLQAVSIHESSGSSSELCPSQRKKDTNKK